MRTLLLMVGVSYLLTGCGRKAAPVAEAPAKAEPRVRYEMPRQPPTARPAREDNENRVADFGGGPQKEVPAFEFPQPRPEEPKRPAPKPPVVEEEEEPLPPRKPAQPLDPLPPRIEPRPAQVPAPGFQPGPLPPAPGFQSPQGPQQPVPGLRPGPLPPPPLPANRLESRPTQPPPAARKPVTEQDMKDIHLFMDTNSLASGKMPPPDLIFAALGASGSSAAKLVASGDIVLTGARQRESCWAYQKGAATDGGWIVTNSGAEQVDAATAQRWLGGR